LRYLSTWIGSTVFDNDRSLDLYIVQIRVYEVYLGIAVFKCGIGESIAEFIKRCNVVFIEPAITYIDTFCILKLFQKCE
jgi:hypothetical protein